MPKLKSHKGLLKRVKVTGRGKVKFNRANTGHLRSGKTPKRLRHLRRAKYAKGGDVKHLKRMLHRPLLPIDVQEPQAAATVAATDATAAPAATVAQ